jgi:hypothetical protein
MSCARYLLAVCAMALAFAVSLHAQAKRTGMNLACNNCHEGQNKPKITATLSANRLEAGQLVTISVTAQHATAKVGGVLVDSMALGSFQMIDAVGTHLFEGMPTLATHAMPHAYANGQVQFSFNWVAPAMVGVATFEVWSNAANDNMDPHDDHAASISTAVSVGCDALWYHFDADLDGAGEQSTRVYSCEPLAGRILQGGDCDDKNPQANPSVLETCNSVDDNCDGTVDEGFTPILLIEDGDGDGYGSRGGMSKIGCPPEPGFAPTFDDCDDSNVAINPGATEVSNLRDDNCNGKVDDVSAGPPGVGSPSAAPTEGGGCQLAPRAPGSALVVLAGLLLAFLRRRSCYSGWRFSLR